MRLDKVLEANQLGSKKAMKQLLLRGKVTVNGAVIRAGDYTVDPGIDCLMAEGRKIVAPQHSYYMLHKPSGVVSAVTDAKHETVIDLLKAEGVAVANLFPVGRLDRDTEGLIFLTTNGQLAYHLAMAKHKVSKVYQVTVNGKLKSEAITIFQEGVVFSDGTTCRPAKLDIITSQTDESHALLEIDEGKFHQVKKMFLTIGLKVVYLKRVSIGPLTLDPDLALGDYRQLNSKELADLHPFFNSQER